MAYGQACNARFAEGIDSDNGGRTAATLFSLIATHRCHIFEMNAESYRFRESVKSRKDRDKTAKEPNRDRTAKEGKNP